MSERIGLPRADESNGPTGAWDRRRFLFGAGAAIAGITMPGLLTENVYAQRADYPRRRIGQVSQLRRDTPVVFRYPWDHELCSNFLLKLNGAAAGGVGPDRDIVAFNRVCTHMGRVLTANDYNTEQGIGFCRRHWTTFDLSRHGMVISGHATEALPQVLLEAIADDIFAVGMQSLIFGLQDNRVQPGR